MRKQLMALLAAFIITGIVGAAVLVVGVNAAVNKNSVPAANSLTLNSVSNTVDSTASKDVQIAQLQELVKQYQAREQQYQNALQQDQAQLGQAQQEIQSIGQLLTYLQNAGIISIDNQGNITVNTGRHSIFGDDH